MTLLDDEEMPIAEFGALRRLAQYEGPDRVRKRAVFVAIREELGRHEEAFRKRRALGRLKWLAPGLVLLSLPTAMAATDVGRHLVEQLREVLPIAFIGAPKEELPTDSASTKPLVRRSSRRLHASSENSAAIIPTALPTAEPVVTASSEPPAPPPPSPAPVVAPVTTPAASRHLEQEAAIIRAARYALSQRDYAFALALTERHSRLFPTGALARERDMIQDRALQEAAGK